MKPTKMLASGKCRKHDVGTCMTRMYHADTRGPGAVPHTAGEIKRLQLLNDSWCAAHMLKNRRLKETIVKFNGNYEMHN